MAAAEQKADGDNMIKIEPILIYIHSLWIFFALSVINTFNPNFFDVSLFFNVNFHSAITLNIFPLICIFFLLIGFLYQLWFKFEVSGAYAKVRKITNIENITHENSMSYLTSNIIPLLSLGSAGFRDLSLTFLIVFITGAVFIKTDMYYLNPTLTLLGYKIYRIHRDGETKELIVMSCDCLKVGNMIKVRQINDNIYIGRLVK